MDPAHVVQRTTDLLDGVREQSWSDARSVELGVSNARVEAVKNKIKLTVRMGYGFRSIDSLIAPVMLRCLSLPITFPGRA